MHVEFIVVLYVPVPEVGEGNGRGMQPAHGIEQPFAGVAPQVPKLYNYIKRLSRDHSSRVADKVEHLLLHLKKKTESKKCKERGVRFFLKIRKLGPNLKKTL